MEYSSSGEAAVARCEAVEQGTQADTSWITFERELQQFIPEPGSSTESSQLRHLRKIQTRNKGINSTVEGSSSASISSQARQHGRRQRFLTEERGRRGEVMQTELFWSGKRLVWSRGGMPVRTFSYEEDIRCACWAWMDSQATWEGKRKVRHPCSPRSSSRHAGTASASTLPSTMADDTMSSLQNRFREADVHKISVEDQHLFRALCIFLPSCLVIYHPHSGQEYMKRLDLEVRSVFPLNIGLFIQRSNEVEDRMRASQASDRGVMIGEAPLSTLFYLRRPFDEFRSVERVDQICYRRKEVVSHVQHTGLDQTFNEVDERIVAVFQSPPVLVSVSLQGRCIRVYTFAHDRAQVKRKKDDTIHRQTSGGGTKLAKEDVLQTGSIPPSTRKSLADGPRARPSTRAGRLPPRKSARLESGSNRASAGGQRSSLAGERSRASSGAGHSRRVSGGMTPLYAQSGLLLGDEEHGSTDEENIQEMMQLLDNFDEADEETAGAHQRQISASRSGPPASVTRRRTSRAFTSNAPTNAILARTPFTKGRGADERRISRSARPSVPGSALADGNPISLAMQLSQKDEASKLTMTATNDKAMSRGVSYEGLEGGDHDTRNNSLLFQEQLSQGFAAVSLIEELPVAELISLHEAETVTAFIQQVDEQVLLHVVLPFCSKVIIRQIIKDFVSTDQYSLRMLNPPTQSMHSDLEAHDANPLFGDESDHLVLLERGNTKTLVAGLPGPTLASTEVKMQLPDAVPVQSTIHTPTEKPEIRLPFKIEPRCPLTAKVLHACRAVLSRSRYQELHMLWVQCRNNNQREEWLVLLDLIEQRGAFQQNDTFKASTREELSAKNAHLLGEVETPQYSPLSNVKSNSTAFQWTTKERASLAECLHWIAQDARLDICERRTHLPRLARVMLSLTVLLGWSGWHDYWIRLIPQLFASTSTDLLAMPTDQEVWNLLDVYQRMLLLKHGSRWNLDDKVVSLCPKLRTLRDVFLAFETPSESFETMSGSQATPLQRTAKAVVAAMLRLDLNRAKLQRLPAPIALPLLEVLKACQRDPPMQWSPAAYRLIGRSDLARQLSCDQTWNRSTSNKSPFPRDHRLEEVGEMLQTSRPVATRGPDVAATEDQEVIAEQQKRVFISASDRIKALSTGRALLMLSSTPFQSTEHWKVSPICLRIRMLSNCIIQHKEPDTESAEMEWPEFHNGVASALELNISQDKIESSWLYNQLNKEFNARNAGLIFGIGLQCQFRHLGRIHAHYYLSSRHSATTIGLLLGISVSLLGSCDPLAKAVMSIHIVHSLPTHNRPLKTSMLEQCAALVGLGYVFMASNDRWATRTAYKAIVAETVLTDENQILKRECFTLSAAFSLGLTCLGRGRKGAMGGEIEKEIVPGLESLIQIFDADPSSNVEQEEDSFVDEKDYAAFEWKPDISLTTTPACIALALIYLKSDRRDKVDKMPLPENVSELDRIRPDILAMRALCRSLIAWSDVQPSTAWLDEKQPEFLRFSSTDEIKTASESCQMAYWSLRLGSIFAIGLKFAGTNDASARMCLLKELRRFQSHIDLRPATYSDKIKQQMLQSSADSILTCLAMVLAGTGDVEVLQHLRKSLYRVDTLRYGNYMSNAMAMGLLFLGAGRFTLSTSDSAIASLLIALYPRYPTNAQDNRCHLQAYRHLWLVAVEARLLRVKDVDSGDTSSISLELVRSEGGDSILLSTPCLLPTLQKIETIKVASHRFFTCGLHVKRNAEHQRSLAEMREVYVKRKEADWSHDDDRWGRSSLRARASVLISSLRLPIAKDAAVNRQILQVERQQLGTMIMESSRDKDFHVLIRSFLAEDTKERDEAGRVGPDGEEEALELFILQCILECLLEDKPEVLPLFLSLYSSTQAILRGRRTADDLLFLHDLQALLVIGQGDTLLRTSYITSLWTLVQDSIVHDLRREDLSGPLQEALRTYASSMSADASQDRTDPLMTQASERKQTSSKQSVQEQQRLACLLLVTRCPPRATLIELRQLVISSHLIHAPLLALTQQVLTKAGFQTRVEILEIFLDQWTKAQVHEEDTSVETLN